MTVQLIECAAPKSVNATTGRNRYARHRMKRGLERDLALLLRAAGVPMPIPGDRVHATATIYSPRGVQRDEGNFRAPLEKALGDALVPKPTKAELAEVKALGLPASAARQAGYLSEDTPEFFTFGRLDFATVAGRPQRCVLRLVWGAHLGDDRTPLEAGCVTGDVELGSAA